MPSIVSLAAIVLATLLGCLSQFPEDSSGDTYEGAESLGRWGGLLVTALSMLVNSSV